MSGPGSIDNSNRAINISYLNNTNGQQVDETINTVSASQDEYVGSGDNNSLRQVELGPNGRPQYDTGEVDSNGNPIYREVPAFNSDGVRPLGNTSGSIDSTVFYATGIQGKITKYLKQNEKVIKAQILKFGEATEGSRKLYQAQSFLLQYLLGQYESNEGINNKNSSQILLQLLKGEIGNKKGTDFAKKIIELLKKESGVTISDSPTENELKTAIDKLRNKVANGTKSTREKIVTNKSIIKIKSTDYSYSTLMKAAIDSDEKNLGDIQKLVDGGQSGNTALFSQLAVFNNDPNLKGITDLSSSSLAALVSSAPTSSKTKIQDALNKYVDEIKDKKSVDWEKKLFSEIMAEYTKEIKPKLEGISKGEKNVDKNDLEDSLRIIIGKAKILQYSSSLASNLFRIKSGPGISGFKAEDVAVNIDESYGTTNKILELVGEVDSEYKEVTSEAAADTVAPFFVEIQRNVFGNFQVPGDSSDALKKLAEFNAINYIVRTEISSFLSENVLKNGVEGTSNNNDNNSRVSNFASLFSATLSTYDETLKGYSSALKNNGEVIVKQLEQSANKIGEAGQRLSSVA